MKEEFEDIDETPLGEPEEPRRKISKPMMAGALALIVVVAFGAWYFFGGGSSGKPVATPKDTSFGRSNEGTSTALASDQKITLTDDQLKAAGLEFTTIGETLADVSATGSTAGVVQENEYGATPVISLVGGVVKEIYPELGEFVKRGETIAVVSSDELAAAESRYLSLKADLEEAEKRYQRAIKLSDISEESRNELDRTTANLRAAEAAIAEKRSNFERSKKLVDIGSVSKREHEKVTTDFETARANLVEAQNRFTRARKLLEIDPARNNEVDQYLTKVRNVQAETAAQRERLLVLGLPSEKIGALKSASQVSALLPIVAPIAGTVTDRKINRGEVVSANSEIVRVTDLSTVWVIGQVYEKDLGKIKTGSGASVRTDSYPGELFRGNVTYIDPSLDMKTRTAKARIELANPGGRLKIGMYVNVAYSMLGGSEKTSPLIPKAAVQTIGNSKVVFLATKEPNVFILREVRLAEERDGAFPALEGVFVGDKVVTNGSFLLRAEWLKTNSETL